MTVLAAGDESQQAALKDWSLPEPSVLSPQWLYGFVQWTIMVAVAIAGSLLIRRRWRA